MHITPNNKIYIGITSQSAKERWRNGKGYKYSKAFYRAILKYGWDNIQHIILFENICEESAKMLEILLISIYKSNKKRYGYNITSGGNGTVGYKHSEKSKEQMSLSKKGKSVNVGKSNGMYGVLPPRTKKVMCINTGTIYESLKQASIANNIASGVLSRALKRNGLCKGLIWREV